MKKFLSVVLCAFMLLGVFAATASATDEATLPTDLRKFGAYGQAHIFLGEPIVMGFPVADGVIGEEEYAVSHEVTNLFPLDIASEEYLYENEDKLSFTQYYSYDADGYLYHAIKIITPEYSVYYEPRDYYGNTANLAISFVDSGDFWAVSTRTSFTLAGRDDEDGNGPFEGGYLYTPLDHATFAFSKEGALTRSGWVGEDEAVVVPSYYHSVDYNRRTRLYTCIYELKINMEMVKESQGVIGDVKSAMVQSNYSIRQREGTGSSTILGYYTQGTALTSQEIDSVDRAYEDSSYVPGSPIFPDMIHFCEEPTDAEEYRALTGAAKGEVIEPPTGEEDDGGSGSFDDGVELEEEELEEEEDDKKTDDTTKAPEVTEAPAEEKGCKSAIGGGALALMATVGCGISVISRKKRK